MAKILKLMFDGREEDCLVQVDPQGEYVCRTRDNRVIKFPAGEDIDLHIAKHNEANAVEPVPAGEISEDERDLAEWLGITSDEEKETQTISADEVGDLGEVLK